MERRELMDVNTYRDMHLLDELMGRPDTTQRELSKRIGVALGLTNLMLRRLVKKGYVKISGTKRSRLRYLITPQGILEKSRLTYQYIEYSLQLYGRVRRLLREQLNGLNRMGDRRILLFGTGELAEVAFLTIQEMGLQFVGVVERSSKTQWFLGYPVRSLSEVLDDEYDRVIIASLDPAGEEKGQLVTAGVPIDRIITLAEQSLRAGSSQEREAQEAVQPVSAPAFSGSSAGAEASPAPEARAEVVP